MIFLSYYKCTFQQNIDIFLAMYLISNQVQLLFHSLISLSRLYKITSKVYYFRLISDTLHVFRLCLQNFQYLYTLNNINKHKSLHTGMNETETKIQSAIWELVTTEIDYIHALKTVTDVSMQICFFFSVIF